MQVLRRFLLAALIASLATPAAPVMAQSSAGGSRGSRGGAGSSGELGAFGSAGASAPSFPQQPTPFVTPSITSPAERKAAASGEGDGKAKATEADLGRLDPLQNSEFQDFLAQSLGRSLPVYGQSLFGSVPATFAPVEQVPVPSNYVIGPGDEIVIRAWGQVDIDFRATVDRNGQINIPKVGTLTIVGIRSDQLDGFLKSAIGRIYRNFDLSASLGQLRSIQVFVVGYANRPGLYTVSSLSTLVNTLFASGGPSVRGSMRNIQLKRAGQVATQFDMYDLLLRGDKSKDVKLLSEDVIYIPPVGPLAAISGSVNQAAIYELNGATSLSDLIGLAGGLTPTASGASVSVERIADRKVRQVGQIALDKDGLSRPIADGDLIQVLALSPRFDNAVTLRGNVAVAARLPWHDGMRVKDLVPSRESLIVREYWLARNQATRIDIKSDRALRTEVKHSLAEINWDYAVIERLNIDSVTTSLIPFNLGKAVLENDSSQNLPLKPGDVVTIFSKDDIRVPIEKQTKYVRLEGEVRSPGVYQVLPGETLRQLLSRVGGLSQEAYVFGSEFTRESTRVLQQKRLDEALDRMAQELERNAAASAGGIISGEQAEATKLQAEGQRRLLARLREAKATGRIVLDLPRDNPQLKDLPEIALEDGDGFVVPSRPSTVGVLGSVYNQNAFLYQSDKRVSDYVAHAGGGTREADRGRIYVVRADGIVIGASGSWFSLTGVGGERLMPGDTIVVPEDFDRFRFTKELKDWSQIFYQFAIGVAGLKVLKGL